VVVPPATVPEWKWEESTTWSDKYPECGKKYQSPIDVPLHSIGGCFEPLQFTNLNWPQNNLVLQNTYRGAVLWFDTEQYPILVTGGVLAKESTYYLVDLFFQTPSCHKLDGVEFPLEMKLDLAAESNVSVLFDEETNYASLSLFVTESPYDNPAWEPIVKGLQEIKEGGSQTLVSFTNLESILPPVNTWEYNYYAYVGSWVYPPCYSGVIRVLYKTILGLSARQIHAFQMILNEDGQPFIHNHRRPIQNLDNRQIFSTTSPSY